MRKSVLMPVSLVFLTMTGAFSAHASPLLVSNSQWEKLRNHPDVWQDLQSKCNKDLTLRPIVTTQAYNPKSAYTETGHKDDPQSKRLQSQGVAAYRLGACYQLTGDTNYAVKAQKLIDQWQVNLKEIKGQWGKAQMGFYMPYFILSASWVRDVKGWTGDSFGEFLETTISPTSVSNKTTNVGSWSLVMDASIAGYNRNNKQLNRFAKRWQDSVKNQINDQGVMFKEVCRSTTNNWCEGETQGIKGIGYTHFNLLALTMAGQVFESQGIDVFKTPSANSLERSFKKVALWSRYPEQFPYYKGNKKNLRSLNNITYFPVLMKHFYDVNASYLLSLGDMNKNDYMLNVLFAY